MSTSNFRILIVDDLPDNLVLLQTILEAEGYKVDTADSGKAALEQIERSLPDLVLLDVMMPDMSGYEVVRCIRESERSSLVPILLVSAHQKANLIQELASGADGFICKPIDFDELLLSVRSFCQC